MIQAHSVQNKNHILRLEPGEDLKSSLALWVREQKILSGVCVSGLGSLSQAHLRWAGGQKQLLTDGPFEVLNLTGTLSPEGLHLHISIANQKGQVYGGHLLDQSIIFTTAEIFVVQFQDLKFSRKKDPRTGYLELEF